ncbi:hypothetical protein [Maribacter litoralis]|uniref:hypothetical protein n=1 Tax=Maribacter litoralis TaxID=2059726 RepID=UPI003D2A2481
MKKISIISCILIFVNYTYARLPPVFGPEYVRAASTSEMVKTYLTPQRIIWQSDESIKLILSSERLLYKGNGQVAVNDENLFRFVSTTDLVFN